MKMHQLYEKIGSSLIGVFTDTIVVENSINKVECNNDIIGGIRETDIKPFTQLMNTDERTTKYKHETIKLKNIDSYDITDGYGMWYVILTGITCCKGVYITGEAGTRKTTTANKIKSQLQPQQYKICTPTHKAALLYEDAQTIYCLFNINQYNHTYLKSAVDK